MVALLLLAVLAACGQGQGDATVTMRSLGEPIQIRVGSKVEFASRWPGEAGWVVGGRAALPRASSVVLRITKEGQRIGVIAVLPHDAFVAPAAGSSFQAERRERCGDRTCAAVELEQPKAAKATLVLERGGRRRSVPLPEARGGAAALILEEAP